MLNNALDYGITEAEFWEMTFAELDRLVASKRRVEKYREQCEAANNYTLAILIGRAFSASMDSNATFPDIHEAYPTLFNAKEREEKIKEEKDNISALRFIHFAQTYNSNYKNKVVESE